MRCPIFCMAWTPEGRRLVTGASSGEFTLWNGLTFNFETILQVYYIYYTCVHHNILNCWSYDKFNIFNIFKLYFMLKKHSARDKTFQFWSYTFENILQDIKNLNFIVEINGT